jgi:hypothetical protein
MVRVVSCAGGWILAALGAPAIVLAVGIALTSSGTYVGRTSPRDQAGSEEAKPSIASSDDQLPPGIFRPVSPPSSMYNCRPERTGPPTYSSSTRRPAVSAVAAKFGGRTMVATPGT